MRWTGPIQSVPRFRELRESVEVQGHARPLRFGRTK
jgi:hypothetical protein